MNEIELNSNYVNKKIIGHILPDEEMRKIGFTDRNESHWYYCANLDKHISFNVSIPKNGSDIDISILDEEYCQPYDYQSMLERDPGFRPAILIRDEVEKHMDELQAAGVLSGHIRGEYI